MAIQSQGLLIFSVKDVEPSHPTNNTAAIVIIVVSFRVQVAEEVGLVRSNVFVLEKPWFRISEF